MAKERPRHDKNTCRGRAIEGFISVFYETGLSCALVLVERGHFSKHNDFDLEGMHFFSRGAFLEVFGLDGEVVWADPVIWEMDRKSAVFFPRGLPFTQWIALASSQPPLEARITLPKAKFEEDEI